MTQVIILLSAALLIVPRLALAQSYPSKPVRLIVPYMSGNTDTTARVFGQHEPPRVRIPEHARPGENEPHPLQERRAGDGRYYQWTGRSRPRQRIGLDAAYQVRQAARTRNFHRAALAAGARTADDQRG